MTITSYNNVQLTKKKKRRGFIFAIDLDLNVLPGAMAHGPWPDSRQHSGKGKSQPVFRESFNSFMCQTRKKKIK